MKEIVAGIDYSMTSPCICVHNGSDTMDFESCTFFYLSDKRKLIDRFHTNIFGNSYPEYYDEIERYMNIAKWSMDILQSYNVKHVYLEGYSMGSKGRVFNIAENTAVLKMGIYLADMNLISVPPTRIKKFATDKGNANKEKMHEAFILENSVNLHEMITPNRKEVGNPVSDIVDAYYICKYGYEEVFD